VTSVAVLTYLAIAGFAAALRRVRWLGRTTSRVFAGISLFALPWILITMAVFLKVPDSRAVLGILIAIPGFVFSVPAVPLMIDLEPPALAVAHDFPCDPAGGTSAATTYWV